MVAFSPPSTRADSARRRVAGIAGAALLALALGFSLVGVPGPPNATLDGSWQEMLIHAHAQGVQFGRDLIFTWGPWGFLCSMYHLGGVEAAPILVWQTAGQFAIALALVALIHPLPLWRRLAFAALFLAFHWLFLDVAYLVLIVLIVISGMMGRGASPARLAAWAVFLGFLAQLKFTYLAMASAGTLAAMVCWVGRGSWSRAWAAAAGFAASVLGAWMAAGQDPDNLYPYLRRSLEITLGYGQAMGLDEPLPAFVWGAGLALACAAFAWVAWRRLPGRAHALGASGFLAFSLLVVWKESFTRADLVPLGGHVFGLFGTVAILAPVVPGLLFPEKRLHWSDLAVVYCLAAVASFDRQYYELWPRIAWQRFYGNATALGRLGALPGEWQRSYEKACAAESLPSIRAAVGRRSVDVYDFNLGAALLNRLDAAPRPVFQGYSAYTPGLEGWNLRFYQSGRAPEFLIWSAERIDNRYPGQDDAMLVAGLAGHYEPLFPDGRYWLFRRTSPLSRLPLERRLLLRRTVRLSEEMALPAVRSHAIWLRADAVPNGLGRLRAALYKPAAIDIATTDNEDRRSVWRLIPGVARDGFLLVPTLTTAADAALFLRGQAQSWVRSFHFEAPGDQQEFWSHVDVGVFELTGVAMRLTLPYQRLVDLGIFDRAPVFVASAFDQEIFDVPEGRAILLHAESEVVFSVPAGAARLRGGFGIREGAYSGDGRTAGVKFDVEAAWPSGRRELLWSRYLEPVGRSGDRGTQRLDVAVPTDTPAELILRMVPGLAGDNRWDWSYVTSVRFEAPASP